MRKYYWAWAAMWSLACQGVAQVSQTANDVVPAYGAPYTFGVNFGLYPFKDDELADLSAGNDAKGVVGVGVRSIRPTLPEKFLEYWGYDIRKDEFEHYTQIGLENIVAFVGYPSDAHKSPEIFCPNGKNSALFRNMYLPIWDGGANGTAVNDSNYYAVYLYKTLAMYGPHVRIWEIWNEPDFDASGNGWKPKDMEGNWWITEPEPCHIAIRAPVEHYVRLLRISYEVIKTLAPNDYVAIGGIGYPSFLDVVLRNTDNPDGGSVTGEYPLKGGAYFDMLSFHSYPHIDGSLREWSNAIMDFKYYRHSDAAAAGVVAQKQVFDDVLTSYGYDGQTYPTKKWIITEVAIPRVQFGDYIGSDDAQRNFVIKATIEAQKHNILQMHFFKLAEDENLGDSQKEFDYMGFYPKFKEGTTMQAQQPLPAGVAHLTMSKLLWGYTFHAGLTAGMQLPNNVNGAAFVAESGKKMYVLWAKTTEDRSELATATYSFPTTTGVKFLEVYQWDYSSTNLSSTIAPNQILLTGSPIFLRPTDESDPSFDFPGVGQATTFPNPNNGPIKAQFTLANDADVTVDLLDMGGRQLGALYGPKAMTAGAQQLDLTLPDTLAAGVYFLRITMNKQVLYRKVFVQMH